MTTVALQGRFDTMFASAKTQCYNNFACAGVAELADAEDLKSSGAKDLKLLITLFTI